MTLTATIEKEELSDGSAIYVSWCRELDIASQGETPREAVANLGEALALFLDGASNEEIGRRFRQFLATPEIITPAFPADFTSVQTSVGSPVGAGV